VRSCSPSASSPSAAVAVAVVAIVSFSAGLLSFSSDSGC